MKKPPLIELRPPLLAPGNILEKITCIRAHRERIFQIYTQQHHNKAIFHNYGHGGAGWTFLFGAVNASMRGFELYISQNPTFRPKSICVIGAGCYGLLTAVLLKKKGHDVYIVAKETENIPSNKAAGFFFPRARKCSTPEERAIFATVGMESYATYLAIIHQKHPFIKRGATLLSAYYGLSIDPEFQSYITQGLMAAPQQIMITFGNNKCYEVMEYKTLFIDAAVLMQELHRNVQELHIPITRKEINHFDELHEPIVFNCAGWGSKKLTGDQRIIPVQGHLITLKNQPYLDQLQYMINVKVMKNALGMPRDELIYYAPKHEGIVGITFLRGQDSETANQHEFDRLLERCHQFFGTSV